MDHNNLDSKRETLINEYHLPSTTKHLVNVSTVMMKWAGWLKTFKRVYNSDFINQYFRRL